MLIKERRGTIDEESTFDLETGEVEEGIMMFVPKRPKSRFGQEWFQMAQATLKTINSHRKALGLEGLVVFNALMARLDFENYIQVSQSDIATELEMKASNVSRAVRKLVELGFVRQGPKVGRSLTYQLHPDLVWKGGAKNHHKASMSARGDGWRVIDGGKPDVDQIEDKEQMKLDFDSDDENQ